jgi:hypothetical protein
MRNDEKVRVGDRVLLLDTWTVQKIIRHYAIVSNGSVGFDVPINRLKRVRRGEKPTEEEIDAALKESG